MGVIYKLTDEVIQFIISQRQSNPLFSCRQLAESASQKFSLHLSKSSVHDVLKESGIITPRGRKPKDKFEIPQEKKKQIQSSLSQAKLLPDPADTRTVIPQKESVIPQKESVIPQKDTVIPAKAGIQEKINSDMDPRFPSLDSLASPQNDKMAISPEYEGAGKIFLKAALWDLGIFSEENIKQADWEYYLTYAKGIKVFLEENKSFFIDLPLPMERCIREAADGLINNVRPLIVDKVSDEMLFKACMDAQEGFKIIKISIVDQKDHIILELSNIMECKRTFIFENRVFVGSNENNVLERSKAIFFPVIARSVDNILNLRGFDSTNKDENIVTLLINDGYDNNTPLAEAVEILNKMYLRDEQNRLVKAVIQTSRSSHPE